MSRLNSVRINDSIVILSEAKNPSRSKTQDSEGFFAQNQRSEWQIFFSSLRSGGPQTFRPFSAGS